MPNYKTHDQIAYMTVLPMTGITAYTLSFSYNDAALFAAGFLLSSLFLSPDLDTDSRIYHRWHLLRFIWYPYRKIIPHRSVWSHSGLLSGAVRFVYMMSIYWIIARIVYAFYPYDIRVLSYYTQYAILFLSVVLSDTIHTLTDYIWSHYYVRR